MTLHTAQERDFALIGELYDHAGDLGAVDYLMPRVATYLRAGASFWYVLPRAGPMPFVHNPYLFNGYWGFTDHHIAHYHAEMWRHDPTLHLTSKTDWTTETHELLTPREIDRNGYMRWIGDVAGVNRRISRTTEVGPGLIGGWSFHMPSDRERDPRERTSFDRIAPHLARVFRITSLFGEADARICSLEATIDSTGRATVLLDRAGRVVWASTAALRLSAHEDGLAIRNCLFGPTRIGERALFDRIVTRLGGAVLAEDGPTQVRVERPSGNPPFVLDLAPAPRSFRREFNAGARIVVTIHDPLAPVDPRPTVWRDLFDLTPAESRIAALSMEGLQDAEIAERIGVGIGTIRTHQRQLLAKTGCGSKAELAHLLTRTL